ncbi:MAG: penicillin-binding protein [Oscillospiraceae bacterium]|nr:penicillin-binding protein [Oscillospiraceae bacterium]
MKKIERRSVSVIILIAAILAGLVLFTVKYVKRGSSWAAFSANSSVYKSGVLIKGTIYDRNGVLLSGVSDSGRYYSDDLDVRLSTLHAVGDIGGNIGTGALSVFTSELTGYDMISGNYSASGKGNSLYLTIDAELNKTAYNALEGRKGTVAVYNYETGEILCMASSPSFDPNEPSSVGADDDSGAYINRFLSSAFTPGSTFKTVTSIAAIEKLPDIYDRRFTCGGSVTIDGNNVTCTHAHGEITFEQALAVSCNCAFAEIAVELGSDTLSEYVKDLGLDEAHSVSGIKTAAGSYDISEGDAETAWSGVGQHTDLVNPEAMLRLMGAIAGGGSAAEPTLIRDVKNSLGISTGAYPSTKKFTLLNPETARQISDMMSYNTAYTYGEENYPGLRLHAKSGTAEVGDGAAPHAWFVGFITNPDHPLAFVVLVENGGSGSSVAGPIANKVLQAATAK